MPPEVVDFSWWNWHGHPSILVGVLALESAYLYWTGTKRVRLRGEKAVTLGQATSFTLGVTIIFVALHSPLHELSDKYLFSAHMVQHILLLWVMPPLIIRGLPEWLLRPVIASPLRLQTAKILLNPIVTIAVFNGVLLAWHLPGPYNSSLEHHNLHIFQHMSFMAAGMLLWWPVMNHLKELPRMSYGGQMLYLFSQSLLPAIVGGIITFADSVIYDFYESAPRVWNISAAADQQIGGLIMKTVGSIVFVGALTVVFFTWAGREESAQARRRQELNHDLGPTPQNAKADARGTES